ncbi:MAG: hypothetical protein H6R03_68, partial [Burkholderiaceae bacterium]|nr:hypothetical protein [Burkholderiaceae bacterium]
MSFTASAPTSTGTPGPRQALALSSRGPAQQVQAAPASIGSAPLRWQGANRRHQGGVGRQVDRPVL